MNAHRCAVHGCDRPLGSRELCGPHHSRLIRRFDLGWKVVSVDALAVPLRGAPHDGRCRVDGCERPRVAGRTLCSMHRTRKSRWGVLEDESRTIKYAPAIGRFVNRISVNEVGCWIWTASHERDGYGIMRADDGRQWRAHRWAYSHFVAPIADGMALDHLCSTPACVNPDHLEPVTPIENTRRWVARKPSPLAKEIPWSASSARLSPS